MSNPVEISSPSEDGRTSIRFRSSSSRHSGSAAERLSGEDELLMEIISHVPAKSLYHFKCVSKHWLNLIDHLGHRKKFPQTLAGLFYRSCNTERQSVILFTDVPGRRCPPIDTSFAFLPNHRRVELLDCCSGLLLCRWYAPKGDKCSYIVCNPAREEWVTLPEPSQAGKVAAVCLGFDPAVSSHFFVFVLLVETRWNSYLDSVDLYSSETGRWVCKPKGWKECVGILYDDYQSSVFLNGRLHFQANGIEEPLCLAAVDTKGDTWTNFCMPGERHCGLLQQSQGCLHYTHFQTNENGVVVGLLVYVLQDYDNKEWMLKLSIETSHISGGIHPFDCRWIAIHPDCDLIFFGAGWAAKLMCYNMVRQQIEVISKLQFGYPPFLPYVPFYPEVESLHM